MGAPKKINRVCKICGIELDKSNQVTLTNSYYSVPYISNLCKTHYKEYTRSMANKYHKKKKEVEGKFLENKSKFHVIPDLYNINDEKRPCKKCGNLISVTELKLSNDYCFNCKPKEVTCVFDDYDENEWNYEKKESDYFSFAYKIAYENFIFKLNENKKIIIKDNPTVLTFIHENNNCLVYVNENLYLTGTIDYCWFVFQKILIHKFGSKKFYGKSKKVNGTGWGLQYANYI